MVRFRAQGAECLAAAEFDDVINLAGDTLASRQGDLS
jgi:hypothetical protein